MHVNKKTNNNLQHACTNTKALVFKNKTHRPKKTKHKSQTKTQANTCTTHKQTHAQHLHNNKNKNFKCVVAIDQTNNINKYINKPITIHKKTDAQTRT